MSQHILYLPLSKDLKESGEPVSITLKPDGAADISKLPQHVQERLSVFGVMDETHTQMLLPADGEAFLDALLASSNLYQRFREPSESK